MQEILLSITYMLYTACTIGESTNQKQRRPHCLWEIENSAQL